MDVWREENPFKKEFSRRQIVRGELKQSRIDLCLAKRGILDFIKNVKYKFVEISDHAAIVLELCLNKGEKGGGTWCLNSSILKEESYTENIKKCINYELENSLYNENVKEWWERLKEKFKKRSIRYSKQRHFMKESKLKILKNELREEGEKIDNNLEYGKGRFLQLKLEIEEYEREKSEGAKIRSRA